MMNTLRDPLLGMMFRGYHLEELLESDGLTKVYLARTQELWQTPELIITLVDLPRTVSPPSRERFIKRFLFEAKRIVQLRHKLLYPLFGYGKQNGYPYLLTPNVPGVTLATCLEQKQYWSPSEAFTILVSIAKALTYIHSQGLVYEFLNPTTIFLQDSKIPQIAKLNYPQMLRMSGLNDEVTASFPYVHLKNVAGNYLGTAEYLAPEVVKGAKPDPRSDIYSLGIILFQLLSGYPPFSGNDYLEVAEMHVSKPVPSIHDNEPDIPVALELVLNHALYRNPEHRFQTPEDFVTAYAHVLDGQPQVQKRSRTTSPTEQAQTVSTTPLSKTLKRSSLAEEPVQSFQQGHKKLYASTHEREKAQPFERAQSKSQPLQQEDPEKVQPFEDDSWLNAAGPVHRQPPEEKPDMSKNQFFSVRRTLSSLDQQRSRSGR